MIRVVLAVLWIALYLIVLLPVMLILFLVKRKDPRAAWAGQWLVKHALTVVLIVSGTRITLRGLEKIPRDEGVLFVSNHRGFFDIITAYAVLPVQTGFVAKNGMRKVPLLSSWMVLLNCLFLDRKDIKQGLKTILTAIGHVKKGISIWICPEGTRSRSSDPIEMLPFHEASLKIAEKSGCPVVPVAIYGADQVLENHFPRIVPFNISIEFGDPFRTKELGPEWKKKTGEYSRTRIAEMLEREHAERTGQPARKPEKAPEEVTR